MRAVDLIRRKRDGLPLSAEQLASFVTGAAQATWPDYQLSAMLMAMFLRGLDDQETADLTAAMVASGERLDWGAEAARAVDKHSTGGVGDKTSLLLAPLAATCGALVPMMSGRGLGHTGGTLDKLEAIPGFRVRIEADEARTILQRVGCVMMSQTDRIVPADRTLYALRDVTATVESIPLISASIMSKKIAEGVRGLVIDVKVGNGAFMKTLDEARSLARSLVAIGTAHGVQTQALLTAMEHPLGAACGNALEVAEAIELLRGAGPADVRDLSLELAARMVTLAGIPDARQRVEEALHTGAALETFGRLLEAQGGDRRVIDEPNRLPTAPHRFEIRAERTGVFQGWQAEAVGRAVVALGGGRDRAGEAIDPSVGVVVQVRRGQRVQPGQVLATLHYRRADRLTQAQQLLADAGAIADNTPAEIPLIYECLE
ncbi:MAG: thymidine phosphorylase [Gemmataceae bacterium]